MTFSKLIKSNKGNILPNKELNSLYKPILNKLDNQFIYDFTFKGPEFNQQLSLNMYKHIDPNINLYKLFLLHFYLVLIKSKESNRFFLINWDIQNSRIKNVSKLIINTIFQLNNKISINSNSKTNPLNKKYSIFKFRPNNLNLNQSKLIKNFKFKVKLIRKLRFTKNYLINKKTKNIWPLFLISRNQKMKYTITNFINNFISRSMKVTTNNFKNQLNSQNLNTLKLNRVKHLANLEVLLESKQNLEINNNKLSVSKNKHNKFKNDLYNKNRYILSNNINKKNNLIKLFHVSIFLRFLIYNLLKFQNLKKLYGLINKKIAADHIKNVISKSKNNIDSNINFNDINNKIIK